VTLLFIYPAPKAGINLHDKRDGPRLALGLLESGTTC